MVCCSLLVLLLPPLVVGLSLGERAGDDERQRLERIVVDATPEHRVDTAGSRLFHTAALDPAAPWPDDADAQQATVVRARLAQVFGVSALALLTYLSVLLARGRLQALFACALFAALPPVVAAGHVLRPETPAALFAMLAVVLLQMASRQAPRARHLAPLRSQVAGGGLMVCAAFACAMACETLPSLGEILLVPGLVLVVAAAQLGSRLLRCGRRRGLIGTPIRAVNRRLLPWTGTSLLAPALTIVLLTATLTATVDELAVTARASELLPAAGFAQVPAWLLLALGLAVGIGRVGLRLGRGARIGPDLVLFVFCAVFLVPAVVGDRNRDPLPQLPAMAVVLSEGLRALVVLLVQVVRRRA